MGISNIISLLGGLGLFLFGMKYMSDGLNQVAGNKMRLLLEKLTRNRFKGFLLGVLVTAVIQSSSATTVMLMGFLNAGIMDLAQATGVIIGANIGTTITAVLIAIDVSAIAPFCIFIGTVMALFSKKQTQKFIGQIILGFGVLFFGLKYMSGPEAMGVLKTSAAFQAFITKANNPFLGLLIGFIMCSVLQSSSASIGVLQALAMTSASLMPMKFAIYLIIGINVGSAMPLFLSALGAKTNAKRAAVIYFIFDFVGMLIFTPIALIFPQYAEWITTLSDNGSVQVAIAHIIFKVVTAFVMLPFIKWVVKLSEVIIKPKEHDTRLRFEFIDKKISENPISTALQIGSEVERMARLVRHNFVIACEGFLVMDNSKHRELEENEELINWLNHNISDFMITVTSKEITGDVSEYIGKLFHVITDLERIGDHAENIMRRVTIAKEENYEFSDRGIAEFKEIYEVDLELLDRALGAFTNKHLTDAEEHQLHYLEDTIDYLTLQAQDNHVQRLREKKCHTSSGVIFTKALQDLERVGDHSYNIAWAARIDKDLIRQI
ncbi:Na/Pi cotransporter family protein [Eubacterium coprostanoligenes]|uniref:Na/Pi cotransporter family protein n=1 Tax=Eubacterium coprostanoligenes TaxID=290054 RepID=UPI00235321EC|nr:Na/Pi cotransporter family protein [Eubacterium coprostanoligenes]MCI6254951.1 Na/Pi cotransporter family protein [Eubacterium coprostanoligenes]MDY5400246.1 Na/Pi cotransporter family protein [Eubacterium coprostanoligenes]